MANLPRFGFTLFVQRGGQKLTLCRALPDRHTAVAVACAMALDRPTGLAGMVIRCEASREQWTATELAEVINDGATDTPRKVSNLPS
jgi:hypothetical protein